MRKVIVKTKVLVPHDVVGQVYQTVEKEGYFHCWGMEAAESSDGNCQWTVAIVEIVETGAVKTFAPDEIRFIDNPTTH
jgi:hypothetical protein